MKGVACIERSHLSGPIIGAVAVLIAIFHIWLIESAWKTKSNVFDELAHITAGYSYWRFNDYRLHPENGNLPQRWASLALLGMNLQFPDVRSESWQGSNAWDLGQSFLFESGNDYQKILWRARLMIAAASGGLALLVFGLARRLYGPSAGIFAEIFYILSPTMLAHGGLATSDLFAAGFFLLTVTMLWRVLHWITWFGLTISVLATSGLVLSKMSWPLLLPMAGLMILVKIICGRSLVIDLWNRRVIHGRNKQCAALLLPVIVHVVVACAIVWLAHGMRYEAANPDVGTFRQFYERFDDTISYSGWGAGVLTVIRQHRLLPEAFIYGMAFVLRHSNFRDAFWMGNYSSIGWPLFFPFAFLAKSSVSLLALSVISAVACLAHRGKKRWSYRLTPLLTLIAVYASASVVSQLNIGHRHLLPIYPPLFIIGVGAIRWRWRARPIGVWVTTSLVAALMIESFLVRPHYLAFFNILAGGPARGYRQLVDSSLDWGQDLPALKEWLKDHGLNNHSQSTVYLAYFGTASPHYYGIKAIRLPSHVPLDDFNIHIDHLRPGYYCISATRLYGLYTGYPGRWSPKYEQLYLQSAIVAQRYLNTQNNPEAREREFVRFNHESLMETMDGFAQLRFNRLCLKLRQREPDAMIGYSILIYKVSEAELNTALFDQPVEIFPTRRIRGLDEEPMATEPYQIHR